MDNKHTSKNTSFMDTMNRIPDAPKNASKKGFFSKIALLYLKALGIFSGGINKELIQSQSQKGPKGGNKETVYHPSNMPSGQEFREGYRFDPEQELLKRRAAAGYMQLVDGRGDPPEHNCNHHHDHGEK